MDTIVLNVGSVEYHEEDARCSIYDLIANLQEAKDEGAEYVVIASGNYRGAKYVAMNPEDYTWV